LKCNQKTIRIEALEEQMDKILNSISILPQFKDWILQVIKENFNSEVETRIKTYESINRSIISEENKIKNALNFLTDEVIDKNEFLDIKEKGLEKIEILKIKRDKTDIK